MASEGRLNVLAITAEHTADAVRRLVLPLTRLCEAHPDAVSAEFAPNLDLAAMGPTDVLVVRAAELPDIKTLVDARNQGVTVVVDLSHLPTMMPKNLGPGYLPTTLNPQLGLALSLCDRVWVSTPMLARHVAPFSNRVSLVNTFIDTELWCVPRPPLTAEDPVALCWLGGPNVEHDLVPLGDSLCRLFEQHPDCGLLSFSDLPLEVQPGRNVWRYPLMPYLGLPAFISGVSVGIAPRARNTVSDASSHAMVVELLALGIPVVASATPENVRTAERCRHLTLASTPDEWLSALSDSVGTAGTSSFSDCLDHYALGSNLDVFATALYSAVGRNAPWLGEGRG